MIVDGNRSILYAKAGHRNGPPRHRRDELPCTPQVTPWLGDEMLDRSYERTKLGPDVVAWLAWLQLGGKSPATIDQYERDLALVCKVCPRKRLKQVVDADLAAALLLVPPGSRKRVKAAFASFYKWAIRTRRVTENPVLLLPDIKPNPKPLINLFKQPEIELLLSLPLIDAVLMGILLDTGIRKEEARNLQLRNTRPESGYLVVVKGKGGDPRAIPMRPRLQAIIADLILLERLEPDDHLWYDRPGGGSVIRREAPIGNTSFTRWWTRCLDEAGVEYRKPHTTRHTYATSLRREGVGLDDLKKLLGHSRIATTEDYYLHGGIEDVAIRLVDLPTWFAGWDNTPQKEPDVPS